MENIMLEEGTHPSNGGSAMDRKRIGYAERRRRRNFILVSCVLIVVSAFITYISRLEPTVPSIAKDSILIATVQRGSFSREVRGIGTLVSKEISWITSSSNARVEKILSWPGTPVQPETIVLLLTDPELQQAALDADAAFISSEAKVVNLRAQLEGDLLERKAALTKAEGRRETSVAERDVNMRLAKNGLIAALDVKKCEIEVREGQAMFEIEKQRLEFAKNAINSQLAVVQSELDQAKAHAQLRHEQLAALQVRAGMTGVVQQIAVEIGQRINTGATLAKVANPLKLVAEVRIPENQARDIVIGQRATIDTRSSGLVQGRVARIHPAVEGGTVLVEVDFGDQPFPRGVRPDLSVEGTIQLENLENVTYVSRPAAGQDESAIYLFKLTKNKPEAERTRVLLGRGSVNAIEIRQGLVPGDQVILSDMSANDNQAKIRLQ